jgi:hypothetical protein
MLLIDIVPSKEVVSYEYGTNAPAEFTLSPRSLTPIDVGPGDTGPWARLAGTSAEPSRTWENAKFGTSPALPSRVVRSERPANRSSSGELLPERWATDVAPETIRSPDDEGSAETPASAFPGEIGAPDQMTEPRRTTIDPIDTHSVRLAAAFGDRAIRHARIIGYHLPLRDER